jgi:hypothetical protein
VNLAVTPAGTISGTVFADPNGTVVDGADVTLLTLDQSGPSLPGGFRRNTFSASDGRYAAANLPAGHYTAIAWDWNTSRTGIGTGVLSPGGASTIDVTIGNATNFWSPYNFDGSINGLRYDIGCDAAVQRGGQAGGFKPAFSGAGILSLFAGSAATGQATFFPCVDFGRLELNDRGVTLEGGRLDAIGLEVTRKVFVPEGGEFGRYLEVLTNRTTVDLTVRVAISGRLAMGTAGASLVVRPSDTSHTVAVFEDESREAPSVGFVFGSASAPVAALTAGVAEQTQNQQYAWVVTVPAGQTRSILHFLVQATAFGATAVANQAFALANLSDPAALAGLTAQEKASIVNFVVP